MSSYGKCRARFGGQVRLGTVGELRQALETRAADGAVACKRHLHGNRLLKDDVDGRNNVDKVLSAPADLVGNDCSAMAGAEAIGELQGSVGHVQWIGSVGHRVLSAPGRGRSDGRGYKVVLVLALAGHKPLREDTKPLAARALWSSPRARELS